MGSRKYRFLLPLATVALMLGMAEISARTLKLGHWPPVDPSRGFLPFSSVLREEAGPDGQRRLVVTETTMTSVGAGRPQFNPLVIPVEKGLREFRVVCLGGSVTYGYPYDDRYSYPRLLEVGLRAIAPNTDWRVLNLGAPGYGSYRWRLLAADLVQLKPDLVVVTIGNNEALEYQFGKEIFRYGKFWTRFRADLARRSRFAAWLVQSADARRTRRDGRIPQKDVRFPRGSAERELLVSHYRENLGAICDVFRSAGVPVLLTTVPVNVRDCPPFGADAPGQPMGSRDEGQIRRFTALLEAMRSGRSEEARVICERLMGELPDCARLRYIGAIIHDSLGMKERAADSYFQANELDAFPLRAFPSLNDAALRIAGSRQAGVVDLVAAVREVSPVPGTDVFFDNCHPRRELSPELARAIAQKMIADGQVVASGDWAADFRNAVGSYLGSVELSPKDEVAALKILLWYYRTAQADEQKAAVYQEEILRLDPDGRYLDSEFRRSFIR